MCVLINNLIFYLLHIKVTTSKIIYINTSKRCQHTWHKTILCWKRKNIFTKYLHWSFEMERYSRYVQENKLCAPEISTNSVRAVLIHSLAEVSIRSMSYTFAIKTCVPLHFSSISFRHHLHRLSSFPFSPRDIRPFSSLFPFLLILRPLDPRTLILKKSASWAFCEIQKRPSLQDAGYTRKDNALPR